MLKRFRSLFHALTHRRDFESAMSEELRFHIARYKDDLIRSGMSSEEATRRAQLEFGSLNAVTGDCRQSRGLDLFDELSREVRHAVRLLRKSPGFTAAALLTLAVCLGANLTIFAAIDAMLLRPLPFPAANRLVTIFNTYPKAGVDRDGSSITNYYERRGRIPALSAISIYRFGTATIGNPGSAQREQITQVSPDFFHTLGRDPILGRAFTEAETTYQTDRVAILSNGYWREHFNSDRHAIGRSVRVDGRSVTVVGVLPADFRFLSSRARLYFPLSSSPGQRAPIQRHSGGNVTQMIARLNTGESLGEAQSQIDSQNNALERDDPQAKMMADAGFRSLVVSLHADHVANIRPILLLMQAGVFALLLIGIVNLVNLLLIRASGRIKEVAVRQALGASARHVVTEVVAETTLLTLAGGLLGLAVGAGGIRLLTLLGADQLPLGTQITFNARLALATLLAAIFLGFVLAAPIAWFNLRGHLAMGLQVETRGGTANRAAQRLRHGFIVAQIALALLLLTASGLLGVSLRRAMAVSPGFRPDHILTARLSLPYSSYPSIAAGLAFTENLVGKLSSQPGVLSAGVASNVPFSGYSGKSAAKVKGYVMRPGESPRGHYSYGVAGDYFGALSFTLKQGRFLTTADSHRRERVCVVDEDFARYYWPKENPLGRRLFQGSDAGPDAEAFTVVGVVGEVKQAGLTDETAQGAIYYPYVSRFDNDIFLAVRTTRPPESLALTLQRMVRQIDPDLPVNDVVSMETRISDSLITRRSPALLATLFSAIALLLTAIGAYGVLSYAVTQRRREIGVRMALGARPEQIRSQFVLLALRLLAAGTVLGVVGAWLASRAMQTVLFHVEILNVPTFAGSALIMIAVCLAACLLPSHRAARVSPMEALSDQ